MKTHKLHELLAALSDRMKSATKNIEETIAVFVHKGTELFTGYVKVKTATDQSRAAELDSRDEKPIVSSVRARLKYTYNLIAEEINIIHEIDAANQLANADIVLKDGTVLASAIPATTLLSLEKKLRIQFDMVQKACTLPNGTKWTPATEIGENIFTTAAPVIRTHTEKVSYPFVLAAATDKHPANVLEKTRDQVVAKTEETLYNGMMPSLEKAEMLTRISDLIVAVSQARQRANETVVPEVVKVGDILANYILG